MEQPSEMRREAEPELNISVNGVAVKQNVWLTDIMKQSILCLDVLKQLGATVDTAAVHGRDSLAIISHRAKQLPINNSSSM